MLDLEEVTTLLKYNGIHATSKKLNVKKSAIHQFLRSNGLVYKDGAVQPALNLPNSQPRIINIKNSATHNSQTINKPITPLDKSTSSFTKPKPVTQSIQHKSVQSIHLKQTQTKNSTSYTALLQTKVKQKNNSSVSKKTYTPSEKITIPTYENSLKTKLDLLKNLDIKKLQLLLDNLDDILELIYAYKSLKKDSQKETASTLNKDEK